MENKEPSLKQALEDTAKDMKRSPKWLKIIFRRNRETEEYLRKHRYDNKYDNPYYGEFDQ